MRGDSQRRVLWLLFLIAVLAVVCVHPALAQKTQEPEAVAGSADMKLRIVNSAIFAVALGWFLWKFAPAFFNARSADIQKAIKDATGLKIEAEFRYSEIDRKMASLSEEVKRIRDEAAVEMEREHQRLREETQAQIQHIHRNVSAEIEAFRKEGVSQLRQHTAQLAMQEAERRLAKHFAAGEPEELLQDFIHLVERGSN